MSERSQRSLEDEAFDRAREVSQLDLAQELEHAAEPVEHRVYTSWQAEFARELRSLQERIATIQEELAREAESNDDRAGTGFELSREGEIALRLELQQAKQHRIRLIDGVPAEHRREAAEVRQDIGVLLEEDPI